MMFLLRAAFWVGLVLILLPSGAKQATSNTTAIKPVEAASAATAAVVDLSQFCRREPQSCAVGSQVAVALGHRAQAGAEMIYHFFTERDATASAPQTTVAERETADRPDATGSIDVAATKPTMVLLPRPRPPQSQDTLTAEDRQAPWRGPAVPSALHPHSRT